MHLIRDPARRQKKQSNKRAPLDLGIVMGSRPRTRPSRTLPTLHTLQLRGLVDLHDTVDLAVGMGVVLSRVDVFAVHVHGRDAEEAGFRAGEGDFTAAVSVAVELCFGNPAFLEALEDVLAKVLVVGITGTVFSVQALFQVFSRCQILHLGKELCTPSAKLLSCWMGADVEDTRLVAVRGSCHLLKNAPSDTSREESKLTGA